MSDAMATAAGHCHLVLHSSIYRFFLAAAKVKMIAAEKKAQAKQKALQANLDSLQSKQEDLDSHVE